MFVCVHVCACGGDGVFVLSVLLDFTSHFSVFPLSSRTVMQYLQKPAKQNSYPQKPTFGK